MPPGPLRKLSRKERLRVERNREEKKAEEEWQRSLAKRQAKQARIEKAEQEKLQKGRGIATERVLEIYSLLEQSATEQAHSQFLKYQKSIKEYAAGEVYAMLANTVNKAHSRMVTTAKQRAADGNSPKRDKISSGVPPTHEEREAAKLAAKVRAYLSRNKIQTAYSTFQRVKKTIKMGMDKQEYNILKERVTNAHDYYTRAKR